MNTIVDCLLDTRSIEIKSNKDEFFTWSSGLRSPIYCDNRKLLSYPEIRSKIAHEFIQTINIDNIDGICGVATAGIAWATIIAQNLSLPLIYVRSKPKQHGQKNVIEGDISKTQCVALIEDLISTGKSSIQAAMNLKNEGVEVEKVYSIFNYELPISKTNFENNNLKFRSLSTIHDLLQSPRLNADQKEHLNKFLCS